MTLYVSSTALILFLQAYAAEKTICGTNFTSAIQDRKEDARNSRTFKESLPYKTYYEPTAGAEQ